MKKLQHINNSLFKKFETKSLSDRGKHIYGGYINTKDEIATISPDCSTGCDKKFDGKLVCID